MKELSKRSVLRTTLGRAPPQSLEEGAALTIAAQKATLISMKYFIVDAENIKNASNVEKWGNEFSSQHDVTECNCCWKVHMKF